MTEESSPGETLPWSAVVATGEYIARMQEAAGGIAWPDGHVEAWDHVECAMAMSVCGLREPARRAYRWLRENQRDDGSWPRSTVAGQVTDPAAESHHAAYVAVGAWHEYLVTGDEGFALVMWPAVRRAVEWTLALRTPRGEVRWERDAAGQPGAYALLTGCSSIHQSLRCAVALAKLADDPRPEWELAADRLGSVVASCPEAFEDKSEFSMDWYYPVLGGAVRGQAGVELIESRWDVFVEPGLGIRCVDTNPWVTGAETCELVMALDSLDDHPRALRLYADMQHLRHENGSYWTGSVHPENVFWPGEQTTYTAAAVILAADELSRTSPASGIMRGETLAAPFREIGLECGCADDVSADVFSGRT